MPQSPTTIKPGPASVRVKHTAIRERRQALGIKQPEFARRAEVSYQHLNNIECGRKQPSIEVVHRIARALGCEASDLLADPDAG